MLLLLRDSSGIRRLVSICVREVEVDASVLGLRLSILCLLRALVNSDSATRRPGMSRKKLHKQSSQESEISMNGTGVCGWDNVTTTVLEF